MHCLTKNDHDGSSENVAKKINNVLSNFNPSINLDPLNLSNARDFSWS